MTGLQVGSCGGEQVESMSGLGMSFTRSLTDREITTALRSEKGGENTVMTSDRG